MAKGQPELGRSPQAAAVMADVRPAGPEGGGNGDGALLARGRVWRRTRELYHDILTAFGKEKKKLTTPMGWSPTASGLQVAWPGRPVAEGWQQLCTTTWLRKNAI